MIDYAYIPHINLLLAAMHIQRDRLESKSKVAIQARLLRVLLQALVKQQPFSDTFYCATYPDVAAAYKAGIVPDLHEHFVRTGFFEGRIGASPQVDETYYASTYPDVERAVKSGKLTSASEHYVLTGIAEGRVPNLAIKQEIDGWMAILKEGSDR